MAVAENKLSIKDFKGDDSTWCPGCGHFGAMAALQRAAVSLGIEPHQMAVISGIGCSGKISEYTRAFGFHTLHGRSLPVAQGVKLANKDLYVVAGGGDGDGYGIGAGHFTHAIRRNIDITYLVMDNHIYGLTKGQTSPTSDQGFITKTSPEGSAERPTRPLEMALANGITFLAQGFSGNINQLTELVKKGLQHKGFSLINIFSPCVTYNKINTYDFYREHIRNLDEEGYTPKTREEAFQLVRETNGVVTGVLYQESDTPCYEQVLKGFPETAIAKQDLNLPIEYLQELESRYL